LPLRNSVLFPMSMSPVDVGRPRSVRLVEKLMHRSDASIGVVAQRRPETVEPTFEDLYEVGTLARVVRVIRLGRSHYSVVLNGFGRFRVGRPLGLEPFMRAQVEPIIETNTQGERVERLSAQLRDTTRQVLDLLPDLPKHASRIIDSPTSPGGLADLIASNLAEEHASVQLRQRILEAFDVEERLQLVVQTVARQLEVLRIRQEISKIVRTEMSRSQREYVLRQQMRDIREELGESADDDELEELREKIALAQLPPEAEQVARKQLGRLAGMQPQSAEYQVARNYVEWFAELPWSRTTPDRIDVKQVRACLDEDHYGLAEVKRRIVEFSAVRQLRSDKKGPIILFVGPPGVGKTSLGRSVARAMGRRYGRISLGGVRDEAEIRGHRRTYVGALPGRIIQALKKVGSRNPVLVLDEVDKMGVDLRGDPAAALLEVLDPEQNNAFVDHYIDVPFDLSSVLFMATANYRDHVPPALRDRMELIELPGYTRTEKLHIAVQFLIPKQLREHALTEAQLGFEREGIETIIDSYTSEAGVRNLERGIAAVCREATVRMAEGQPVRDIRVNREWVEMVMGVHRYQVETAERKIGPGVATGLCVTPTGGELMYVEATRMPGKGEIRITGNLRSVMKESAAAAVSYVRSHATSLRVDPEWLKNTDLHLHVPRGGRAGDAASAGVTMFVAVVSLLLGVAVRSEVAVVGEITLRGSVLPVGGVKAKILAAHRAGITEVVLPARNACDLEEVPEEVREEMQIHLVRRVGEVLPLVLTAERPSRTEPSVAPPHEVRP
jgi:ATP-dependent Lon protease